jgi:hypothetical protein
MDLYRDFSQPRAGIPYAPSRSHEQASLDCLNPSAHGCAGLGYQWRTEGHGMGGTNGEMLNERTRDSRDGFSASEQARTG